MWMEEEEPQVHPIESPRVKTPQQVALIQDYPRKIFIHGSNVVQTTNAMTWILNHLCQQVHILG